jgi:hypothetical protein
VRVAARLTLTKKLDDLVERIDCLLVILRAQGQIPDRNQALGRVRGPLSDVELGA